MSRKQLNWQGTSALVLGIVAWGSMPVFLRGLAEHVDPFTANGTRYPFAALLYWPLLI